MISAVILNVVWIPIAQAENVVTSLPAEIPVAHVLPVAMEPGKDRSNVTMENNVMAIRDKIAAPIRESVPRSVSVNVVRKMGTDAVTLAEAKCVRMERSILVKLVMTESNAHLTEGLCVRRMQSVPHLPVVFSNLLDKNNVRVEASAPSTVIAPIPAEHSAETAVARSVKLKRILSVEMESKMEPKCATSMAMSGVRQGRPAITHAPHVQALSSVGMDK